MKYPSPVTNKHISLSSVERGRAYIRIDSPDSSIKFLQIALTVKDARRFALEILEEVDKNERKPL